jgi:peptide/nickel transport system substrate-binding protein
MVPHEGYVNVRSYAESKGPPPADELTIRLIPEPQVQLAALETGEINIIQPQATDFRRLEEDDNYTAYVSEVSTSSAWIEFASLPEGRETGVPQWNPPFDDIRLRQAVGFAINTDEVIETVLEGLAQRNYSPQATGWFSYDPSIQELGYEHDPERANALLDEAGWVKGDDGIREKDGQKLHVIMAQYTDPNFEAAAQVYQSQLREVGFEVELKVLEYELWHELILPGTNHHMSINGTGWPDPDEMHYRATNDLTLLYNYRPKEYFDALVNARLVSSLEERTKWYDLASRDLVENAVIIPTWSPLTYYITRKEVKGFMLAPVNQVYLHDSNVEE